MNADVKIKQAIEETERSISAAQRAREATTIGASLRAMACAITKLEEAEMWLARARELERRG